MMVVAVLMCILFLIIGFLIGLTYSDFKVRQILDQLIKIRRTGAINEMYKYGVQYAIEQIIKIWGGV